MPEPHDPNVTADLPPSDSLDVGLAAGFGRPEVPRSSLSGRNRSVLLKEAEGESASIVKPNSDAMPLQSDAGDRYQLAGEIARGGMGAVLRGRDVDLGRDLAVKVLLEKYVNRPEIAQRFFEEAQIGGQLQHPGVVPVYDIGRFGDRPFFTMKLVKGKTLAAILGERSAPAEDRPRLLNIFAPVAQAMAYAHAKGVIHRDLKPANIMVGAFGEVQVMDWGLAKVLAEGGIADEERSSRQREQPSDVTTIRTARSTGTSNGTDTQAGSLLGTPAYMPPEQANGDVERLDRRADVFGLGAILCEILTGKPPYVGRSGEETRRQAANGDLADAMARLNACGADAELITLAKACLAPEAIDRPKDAQVVADSLTAYLNGVQERLRQAEFAEVAAKAKAIEEVKRRRLTVVLAAAVLLAMALGGGGWLYIKTERDARIARATQGAEEAFNQATILREKALSATTGGAALFAQAREQAQRALTLVGNVPVDAALRDRVTSLGVELDEEEKDHKLIATLEDIRLKQTEIHSLKSQYASERAVPLFREAFQAYGVPAGEGEPAVVADRLRQRPPAVRAAIVAALDDWDDLTSNAVVVVAEPHRNWLRAVRDALEPDDAWSRAVRAARAEPDKAKRRAALTALAASADVKTIPVRALTRLGTLNALGADNDLEPANAVKLLRRAQEQYPSDFWVNHHLGQALGETTPQQLDEAVRFLTTASALRPESPGCLLNLGRALDENGRKAEALSCYRKAVKLDPNYAAAYSNLGSLLGAQKGSWDEAISYCRKSIELQPKHPWNHDNLGNLLQKSGRVDEAIACYRAAIELDPKFSHARDNLSQCLAMKGKTDDAIANYRTAIEVDPSSYRLLVNFGSLLSEHGRVDEAILNYQKAIALKPRDYSAYFNLGNAYLSKGEFEPARTSYEKACELDPKLASCHYSLGLALQSLEKHEEAELSYRKALDLDPGNPQANCNLGQMLLQRAKFAESLAAYRRGHKWGSLEPGWQYPSAAWVLAGEQMVEMEKKLPEYLAGDDEPGDFDSRFALAQVCFYKKRYFSAAQLYGKALDGEPGMFEQLHPNFRDQAVRSAIRAAAGKGEDAFKLNGEQRTGLRKRTLDWLRGDLAFFTKVLENPDPMASNFVKTSLVRWQKDADFAAIRDAALLAKLSADEQKAFAQLWADVAAVLKVADKTN
ncbi:MAG: tetratricopeptide repeat protein [Pirellulaceae bacterium]